MMNNMTRGLVLSHKFKMREQCNRIKVYEKRKNGTAKRILRIHKLQTGGQKEAMI